MPIYNMVRKASSHYEPPTWAGGTDAEIVEALEKHYAGEIDLTEYWSVGDERQVSLSAMDGIYSSETHTAQDAVFLIANVGGKTLSRPINGHTECAFVWEMKGCLDGELYLNMYNTSGLLWKTCSRREWCNEEFFYAMPSYMQDITKSVANDTLNYGNSSSSVTTSYDTIAIPSVTELGYPMWSNVEGSTWAYHNNNITSLYKTYPNGLRPEDYDIAIWTRSGYRDTPLFYYIFNGVPEGGDYPATGYAIFTFGCI